MSYAPRLLILIRSANASPFWSPPENRGAKRSAQELYCGKEGLTKALNASGAFVATGHDLKKPRLCDVTNATNQKRYLDNCATWDYTHEGLECQTWSVAANGKYRNQEHIWGYPRKHQRFTTKRSWLAAHANRMARFSLEHFERRLNAKKI